MLALCEDVLDTEVSSPGVVQLENKRTILWRLTDKASAETNVNGDRQLPYAGLAGERSFRVKTTSHFVHFRLRFVLSPW